MSVASFYRETCVLCEQVSIALGKFTFRAGTFLEIFNTSIEAAQLTRAEKHIEAFELMKRIN